ncbi:MAG: hypothetical protein ACHP9Z_09940 [Streptosporangiales bacterium]
MRINRMRAARRPGAAAVAAALGVTLGVSASAGVAQAAGGGGWQRVYRSTSGTSNQLYSVAAISGSNAWAVGS